MSERPAPPPTFITHVALVTAAIAGRPLDQNLADALNTEFPADGDWFATMKELSLKGCEAGWLCAREAGGIKFGRAAPASAVTHGMSIDVVEMNSIIGPHHSHPNGEIDLVMPLDGDARFDGSGAGWVVYGPGSAHNPTVSDGKALVLYLLPDGAIAFSRGQNG